ncbi:unnamed protein product, partial [marine sediment metagenome]
MPDLYLSDTRRVRDFGDGTCGVEYYDVGTDTWIAERKPQTIYCDPWAIDITDDGWTPAGRNAVAGTNFPYSQLEYDAGAEECAFWRAALPPNFDATQDIIIKVFWKASTAVAGDVVWGVSVLGREEGDDIDAAALGTEVEVVDTVQGVVEQLTVTTITLGPAEHVLAANDMVILKLARKAADAADTLADDADVVMVKADIAINPATLITG